MARELILYNYRKTDFDEILLKKQSIQEVLMNKVLSLLIAGAFVTGLFASTDTTNTRKGADAEKGRAIEQIQNSLPDSVKSRIAAYKSEISELKTQISTQRQEFQSKIAAQKDSFKLAIEEFTKLIPDSLKNASDLAKMPDSTRAHLAAIKELKQQRGDSLNAIIAERRTTAKEELKTALGKIDEVQKVKFEKALNELEKQLADRQMKAEEAKAKLEAKKAEIIKNIETKKTGE
jgi:hypothetical protein